MRTGAPVTRPLLLADHARGTASTINGFGDTASSEKRSFCQPMPVGVSHFSRCTLTRPHDFICSIVHSDAFCRFGDHVRRGPCTSVSQLVMSMTCERSSASDLMRSI